MKSVVIQKAFVISKDGKLLALKRSDTDIRRPGEWDLPGGWHDEGESFEQGVLREVKEETGIVATNPKLLFAKTEIRTWQEGDDANKQGNCVFLFYSVDTKVESIQLSHEHSAYKWMTQQEAIQAFTYKLHNEAISYALHNQLL